VRKCASLGQGPPDTLVYLLIDTTLYNL
jgi:hypothetical protein